ncbi:hypothetical protein CRYUN_Cryun27aG0093600 [Craigia yunnanensis]
MELRSSTHLHFVQAIKGDLVCKSMNVDTRGRPALKFKGIKDIYNLRDTIYHNQVPTIYLRDDLESSPTKCYVVEVESPDSSFMRGIKIKSEPEASNFNYNSDGGERNNDLDDFSFGNMTLKQIKKRSKTKKRKRLNSVGLNEETVETCSSVKHEFSNFQHKDDEEDLEEPLISWKYKLSKKLKSKRKSLRKSVSVSSPMSCPYLNLSSEQVDSIVTVCNEVPETTNVHILETEVPYPTKEPQYCSLNEVSYEYMEIEPKFDVGVSSWELVQVDSPEIISYEYSDLSGFRKEDYIIHPLPYDVSSELMSPTKDYSCDIHDSCQSNSPKREMPWQTSSCSLIQVPETTITCGMETEVSGWEIVKVDSPEIISYQYSDLKEFGKESYTVYPLAYDVSSESMSPTKDHCTDLHDSFKGNSSEHKMASQTSNYGQIEWPEIDSDYSLQCLENINEDPVSGDSPSAEKQSLSPAFITINYFDASGRPMASPGPREYHQMKHQHRPERVLSSRKAISPISQVRLCRAMELIGLDENERHLPLVSGACTTVQCCSQSVIAFTQRQMRDIESLAAKLTTELKLMKDIVKGKLHLESEVSAASSAKENADEVRIAIENATRVEETARRWLSMMAKDCNCFCKIMRLSEDNTVASERVINKERKITFAIEAGGKLCHVKVFKDDMGTASLLECGNEKQRLLVE